MSEKTEERKLMLLIPMLGTLPDKFSFSFEIGEDGIAKFSYEEEVSSEELAKETLDMIKRKYNSSALAIRQDGLKVLVDGQLPPPLAAGCILGEVLAQAVYYLGKEKIRELLDMFPGESDYVSKGKIAEAIKMIPKDQTLKVGPEEKEK